MRANRPRLTAGAASGADDDEDKAIDDMVHDPPSELTGNNRDDCCTR
jgi:hypothetical protein